MNEACEIETREDTLREIYSLASTSEQLIKTRWLNIDTEQEDDGRWIAEVDEIPGALAYGTTREDAIKRVTVLALSILSDEIKEKNSPETEIFMFKDAA
jgi:predicted RNase H-like HicB family nuclease